MKSCPNCKKIFSNIGNDFKGRCYEQDDEIETYNHNRLKIEYCGGCGYVLKTELIKKEE